MSEKLTAARLKAWETRRQTYGPRGHAGSYRQASLCLHCARMRDALIRLHNEGVLSEGQTAKATGMGRVEMRRRADELRDPETVKRETSAEGDAAGSVRASTERGDSALLNPPETPGTA
jgi:hypothetical protein